MNIYEYAATADDVYNHVGLSNISDYKKYLPHTTNVLKSGFKISYQLMDEIQLMPNVEWYRIVDIDAMIPSQPFYCQLYVKITKGCLTDVVMAIRGTVPYIINNIKVDIHSFQSDVLGDGSLDSIPAYLNQAIIFYNKCANYLRDTTKPLRKYWSGIYAPEISITGHSLGGAIAQLIALQAWYSSPVVTFNSPGCAHMPNIDKDKKYELIVHNVNAKYDFISKVGLSVGHMTLIDVPQMEWEAKLLLESLKREESKMENIEKSPHERFLTYLKKLDKIHHTASIQKEYLTGLKPEEMNFLASFKAVIEEGTLLGPVQEYAIYEQHSMDNLFTVLAGEKKI